MTERKALYLLFTSIRKKDMRELNKAYNVLNELIEKHCKEEDRGFSFEVDSVVKLKKGLRTKGNYDGITLAPQMRTNIKNGLKVLAVYHNVYGFYYLLDDGWYYTHAMLEIKEEK